MKKSVIAYIYSLLPFAVFFLFKALLTLKSNSLPILAVIILMFSILEMLAIRLPSGPIISLTSALSMVVLFSYGVNEAITSAATAMLIVSLLSKQNYYKTLYNTTVDVIAIYLAGVIFYGLNGVAGQMDILVPWPYIGAIITYYFFNSMLTAVLFSLLQEDNVFKIWYIMMSESFKVYITEQILAFASAYMFINQGLIGLFLLAGFLFMLQMVFRSNYYHVEKEKERAVEFEAILNTAQSGILMINRFNNVKMMNKRFEQIFGIEQELQGKPVTDLFQILNEKITNQEILVELLEKNKTEQNIEIILNQREKKVLKASITPILEGDKLEIGKIITLTDITSIWEKNKQLQELYESVIRSLAAAVDARDAYTSGHSIRVADLVVSIGKKLNLPDTELEVLRYAGLLHDIGKIGIDDIILRKKGPLTKSEWAQMKEHPIKGVAILEEVRDFKELIPIIKYHHERYDGNGYLEGLKGENIPLGSRIIAIADAFDAMTSDRSYRTALPVEEAMQRLLSGKDIQFDPVLVDLFYSMVEQGEVDLDQFVNEGPKLHKSFEEDNKQGEDTQDDIIVSNHSKILAIFYQISMENCSLLNIKSYLRRLLEIIHDNLRANLYSIYLKDNMSSCFKLTASTGLNQQIDIPKEIYIYKPQQQELLRLNKIKISKNQKEHLLSFSDEFNNNISEVVVPIIKENLIAVLLIKVFKNNNFSEDELYFLMTLANQLGQTIESEQAYNEAVYASKFDYLTDVLNHGQFIKVLEEELIKAKKLNYPLSLCIADLDQFKGLNDSYGHLIGDMVLKQFASYLKKNTRGSDVVARYGGDEFAIILPGTDNESAVQIMTRILANFNNKEHFTSSENIIMPNASIGVATFPDECNTIKELIQLADSRMYQFKKSNSAS